MGYLTPKQENTFYRTIIMLGQTISNKRPLLICLISAYMASLTINPIFGAACTLLAIYAGLLTLKRIFSTKHDLVTQASAKTQSSIIPPKILTIPKGILYKNENTQWNEGKLQLIDKPKIGTLIDELDHINPKIISDTSVLKTRLLSPFHDTSQSNWLNCDIILEFFNILEKSSSNQFIVLDNSYIATTDDFNEFIHNIKSNKNLRGLTRKLQQADKIIAPFSTGSHWFLICIEKHEKSNFTITTLDSFNIQSVQENLQIKAIQIIKALFSEHKQITINHKKLTIPKQDNSYDCGVSICYFAELFRNGSLPQIQLGKGNYTDYRLHIAKEILKASPKETTTPITVANDSDSNDSDCEIIHVGNKQYRIKQSKSFLYDYYPSDDESDDEILSYYNTVRTTVKNDTVFTIDLTKQSSPSPASKENILFEKYSK